MWPHCRNPPRAAKPTAVNWMPAALRHVLKSAIAKMRNKRPNHAPHPSFLANGKGQVCHRPIVSRKRNKPVLARSSDAVPPALFDTKGIHFRR